MITRDISTQLKDLYGVDASAEMISRMTDCILPIAKEWQNRSPERKYAIVFMDAVHFYVREHNRTEFSGISHFSPSPMDRFFDKLTLIIVNRHTIEYNERRNYEEFPGVFDTPDVLNLHLL